MEEDKDEVLVGREGKRLLQFIDGGVRRLRIPRFGGPAVARVIVEGVLADAYIAEDREVMLTGKAVLNRPWFVIDRSGCPGWFNSSKVPLRDPTGKVIGVAGVRYPVETPEDRARYFRDLAPVVRHLEEHFSDLVSMAEMARLAGLSPTHFNRRFRRLTGVAPGKYRAVYRR